MGEARRKPKHHAVAERNLDCAGELLTAIAQAKRCAVALKEACDSDLPGAIGDFVAIFPNGKLQVIADDYMRRAALATFPTPSNC